MLDFIKLPLFKWFAGGAAIVMALALVFAGVQTYRLGNAQALVTVLQDAAKVSAQTIVDLRARIFADAEAIKDRDALIDRQNAAVALMAKQSVENDRLYEERIAAAKAKAQSYQAQIATVRAAKASSDDKAVQYDETLALIRETIRTYQKEHPVHAQ